MLLAWWVWPAPEVPHVRILPPLVRADTTPRCEVRGLDGAPRWSVDGEGVGAALPALKAGQIVRCAVDAPVGPPFQDEILVRGPAPAPPNLLVVLADDVGADQLRDPERRAARTPTLHALASRGLVFTRAYANAVCSPSRAALLTGRYGRRTGVGTGVQVPSAEPDLPAAEVLWPAMLRGSPFGPWDSAAIGKWHLTTDSVGWATAPRAFGFKHFSGTAGNLTDAEGGRSQSYFRFRKSVDGDIAWVDRYATTDTVDDAVTAARSMEPPWLLYVAFNAAHTPQHDPPRHLLDHPAPDTDAGRYHASLQAMDRELGRLLAAVPEDTLVFFTGDNGTSKFGYPPGPTRDRAKGTLFESGVHVPLIVAGPGVTPGHSAALIDPTDLYATLAEIADVPLDDGRVRDGISFAPYFSQPDLPSLRSYAWVEEFGPSGCAPAACLRHQVAMIGERYKLMWSRQNDEERVYDLRTDPDEQRPLRAPTPSEDPFITHLRVQLRRDLRWHELDGTW